MNTITKNTNNLAKFMTGTALLLGLTVATLGGLPAYAATTTPSIVLQGVNTGRPAIWKISPNGTLQSGALVVQAPNASPNNKVVGSGDFDNDGITDLVLQSQTTKEVYIWFINQSSNLKGGVVVGTATGYNVVGVGKVDGDVTPDLILQEAASGRVAVWSINPNGSLKAGNFTVPATYNNPQIKVAGIADVDGDGISDVVLQSYITAEVYVWLLNGNGSLKAGTSVATAAGYKAVAVGKVDGDMVPDVILQNIFSGRVAVWNLNANGSLKAGNYTVPATYNAPANVVVGSQDFDNDGITDLVLQNSTTGADYIWFLNSNGSLRAGVTVNTSAGTLWQVRGTGKF
jgi:FG-GAP-like repeat